MHGRGLCLQGGVYLVERKQGSPALVLGDGASLFSILIHQLIAPPRDIDVLRLHAPIVGATVVEVFEGEKLVLCNH